MQHDDKHVKREGVIHPLAIETRVRGVAERTCCSLQETQGCLVSVHVRSEPVVEEHTVQPSSPCHFRCRRSSEHTCDEQEESLLAV